MLVARGFDLIRLHGKANASLPRPQDQLLHSPIQQLGDIDDMLGWASDFVNPLNSMTMSEPLSTAQILSSLSTRTECPNDQAYRFLPISRDELAVGCEFEELRSRSGVIRPRRVAAGEHDRDDSLEKRCGFSRASRSILRAAAQCQVSLFLRASGQVRV